MPIVVSIVTLVVLGLYTLYTRLQWHEMIRAANAATEAAYAATRQVGVAERSLGTTIDSFHLDQRAWVGPTRVEMKPMHAPDPIVAEVTISNSGKTPALRVDSQATLHATDTALDISEYLRPPTEKRVPAHEFTLLPNVPMVIPAKTGSTDDLGIQSVGNGRKFIYLIGTIYYFDVFKIKHTTRFCALYDHSLNKFSPEPACDYAD